MQKDPPLSFECHPTLRKLEVTLVNHNNAEDTVGWLSKALSTIISNVFTGLTISIPIITSVGEDQVRGWSSLDDVLDRFSPCADVTLVLRPQYWVAGQKFEDSIRKYFPSISKHGKVVFEEPPLPDLEDELLSHVPQYYWLEDPIGFHRLNT